MKKDKSADLELAYRANKEGYLAWATKATRSITDAEDLVQEAFATALANTESLIEVEDLAAWLFSALRNKVRDLWRRRQTRKRAGESEVADEVIAEIVAASGLDPAELAEEAEFYEALEAAIEALPDEQREVIEAQVLDGFTFREIAEDSELSIDTLAARKRYAVRKLAVALRDWYE
jgi:RNA polymerase sigma factor (sigma-70 family)